ncbi:SRPBCC family protein [Asanoa sp. NPDC049573]|uniref:SRPBCC family protein n=1 Tax=Asanoa sp. NPDC049573 TaxID=3155396 RepID=UPI00344464FF
MKDYEPGPLAEARTERASEGRWALVFIRDFPHPPPRVWRALTVPAELGEWAPYTADRDLAALGPATLTMIDSDQHSDIAVEVTEVDPERSLTYSWGTDLLRWDLVATPTGSRLTLHHTVSDPSSVTQVAAGWHICLDVAERLLSGNPVGPIRGNEARAYGWESLRDAYALKLDHPSTEEG